MFESFLGVDTADPTIEFFPYGTAIWAAINEILYVKTSIPTNGESLLVNLEKLDHF